MAKKDDPPEPETETPPEPETETPPPPSEHEPNPADMPEWGKTLMGKIEGLEAAVTDMQTNPPQRDDTPIRKPWHKKGIK